MLKINKEKLRRRIILQANALHMIREEFEVKENKSDEIKNGNSKKDKFSSLIHFC